MLIGLATAIRNARMNAIAAAIDAGAGAGIIRIYTAPRPATGAAITSQVLLAQLTFSDPSFATAADGSITANAITSDTSADDTGTPIWFRILDSDLNFVMDGSIGLANSALNLNNLVVVAGVIVGISSMVLTDGNV